MFKYDRKTEWINCVQGQFLDYKALINNEWKQTRIAYWTEINKESVYRIGNFTWDKLPNFVYAFIVAVSRWARPLGEGLYLILARL